MSGRSTGSARLAALLVFLGIFLGGGTPPAQGSQGSAASARLASPRAAKPVSALRLTRPEQLLEDGLSSDSAPLVLAAPPAVVTSSFHLRSVAEFRLARPVAQPRARTSSYLARAPPADWIANFNDEPMLSLLEHHHAICSLSAHLHAPQPRRRYLA